MQCLDRLRGKQPAVTKKTTPALLVALRDYYTEKPNLQDVRVNWPVVSDGTSLVMNVCKWENQSNEVLNMLLEHGANPNSSDKMQLMPLLWCVTEGRIDRIRLLLAHGADVNRHWHSLTAMSMAEYKGRSEIVKLLKQAGAKNSVQGRASCRRLGRGSRFSVRTL